MGADEDAPGLADVLANNAKVSDVIVDMDGIAVMSAGTPGLRVSDRLNTTAFDSMVAELRGRYDLILFDAPPAVVSGDGMILANKLDAAIVLVRAHQDHRGLVARMIRQMSESRCELLGVILNRPRGIAGGYLRKNYATMAEYSAGNG
jgi:Mrp family chromosome partitioning ATPase